ncbi:S8 family serine peptidase (plasmid) [Deinococcus radiomollis]|uniref:S8 family serine peptidase n=1 Tax=Deinococcus radiomollis TaxID=468916 RepID=UPI00389246E8
MTSTLTRLLLTVTVSLLTACGSTPSSQAGDRPGQAAPRYDYLATVPLQIGDTATSVQSAVGGTVVAWDNSGCVSGLAGSCQALVGMNSTSSLSAQSLGNKLGRPVAVEANKDQFSGGGVLTSTMSGSLAIWADGSLAIWADGHYAPIPQNSNLWNTVHLQQAQGLAPHLGAGVTVAVIDTGLDLKHPAFAGSLTDPSTWIDYVGGDAVPQDEGTLGVGGYGHGTNVAGIILQIAPKAKIMPIRVLGPDGSGDVVNVANAITWAGAHGANVINLSLGSLSDSPAVRNAISAVLAKHVLVTSSAGNSNIATLTFPAANPLNVDGLVSVGSVDSQDVKSAFSNYSQNLRIVAPGENVYAPAPGNMMAAWSGTSQAAPMAAGALALALGEPLKVPVSNLEGILQNSAFNIYTNPLNSRFANNQLLGNGRLDLSAFLAQSIQ